MTAVVNNHKGCRSCCSYANCRSGEWQGAKGWPKEHAQHDHCKVCLDCLLADLITFRNSSQGPCFYSEDFCCCLHLSISAIAFCTCRVNKRGEPMLINLNLTAHIHANGVYYWQAMLADSVEFANSVISISSACLVQVVFDLTILAFQSLLLEFRDRDFIRKIACQD